MSLTPSIIEPVPEQTVLVARAALNEVATSAPEWVTKAALPEWLTRYATRA